MGEFPNNDACLPYPSPFQLLYQLNLDHQVHLALNRGKPSCDNERVHLSFSHLDLLRL